ncbi:MAG TPA: hypothetical protein VKB28_21395 [Solirubrobacteraceae bacterium]|nr:hypothetical protein [Solirubrobacteraceae bacterium]
MLAYVFWHRPGGDEIAAYEARLTAFHAALAEHPPAGFTGSAALRVQEAPWLPGDGHAYEDWYGVETWEALGGLNEAAVRGERAQPHDAVAARARTGAGGVYRLIEGPAELAATRTSWLAKPDGVDRDAFHAQLAGPGRSLWMRQMVLGPAPEYAVRSGAPVVLPYEARAIASTPL